MKFLFLIFFLLVFGACEKNRQAKNITSDIVSKDSQEKKNKVVKIANDKKTKKIKIPEDVGPKAPAIFFLSGLKGYTEPCGCTLDIMLGGIDRLIAYYDDTQNFYPKRLSIHVGDLFFDTSVSEENINAEKARVMLVSKAIKRLGVKLTVPGPKDFELGTRFYSEALKKAGVTALAQNISVGSQKFPSSAILDIQGKKIGFVGIVEPKFYRGKKNIKVMDPDLPKALKKLVSVDIKILLVGGEIPFGRQYAEGFDFVVAGMPRETDQSDFFKNAWTLEPYDQGRYVGVLKLFNIAQKGPFKNANTASQSKLEKIEKQKERVNSQINASPPATPGNESERVLLLRQRLSELSAEETLLKKATLTIPETQRSFLWRSIPMVPELRNDSSFEKERITYNKSLKQMSLENAQEIVAAQKGKADFLGTSECAKCHANEFKAWQATAHARAFPTLVERDKEFDHKCVGCHVVGFEKPGGSVLGKYIYDANIHIGENTLSIQKDLRNVGCENCHGPGSLHRENPTKKGSILLSPPKDVCMECHVPEHSPRFNFDSYMKKIVVPGHGLD